MYKSRLFAVVAVSLACVASPLAVAEEQPAAETAEQAQEQPPVQKRGNPLMSPEEVAQHREKLRSLKTEEERKAYLAEHRKMLRERAKQQRLKQPEVPKQESGSSAGEPPQGSTEPAP